jgi:hypothetical protein
MPPRPYLFEALAKLLCDLRASPCDHGQVRNWRAFLNGQLMKSLLLKRIGGTSAGLNFRRTESHFDN